MPEKQLTSDQALQLMRETLATNEASAALARIQSQVDAWYANQPAPSSQIEVIKTDAEHLLERIKAVQDIADKTVSIG